MGVLEDKGPALLESYPLQGLSWEQVKELKGPNLVGLGIGPGPAPGDSALSGNHLHVQLHMKVGLGTCAEQYSVPPYCVWCSQLKRLPLVCS